MAEGKAEFEVRRLVCGEFGVTYKTVNADMARVYEQWAAEDQGSRAKQLSKFLRGLDLMERDGQRAQAQLLRLRYLEATREDAEHANARLQSFTWAQLLRAQQAEDEDQETVKMIPTAIVEPA